MTGLVPSFLSELFAGADAAAGGLEDAENVADEDATPSVATTVTMSFLELYNDSIFDLLALADKIAGLAHVRGNAREVAVEAAYRSCRVEMTYISNGASAEVSVPGARTAVITSVGQAVAMLTPAMAVRRSASTAMNAHSSRSHAILQVKVSRTETSASRTVTRDATACLVDLAGSERAKRTGAAGSSLKEASAINHSLLTLGNVMKSLADQHRAPKSGGAGGRASHKAWRDDLLTQLLHPCLDGASRAAFIITISPDAADWEQSLQSLDFARRAGQITVRPLEAVRVVEAPAVAAAASGDDDDAGGDAGTAESGDEAVGPTARRIEFGTSSREGGGGGGGGGSGNTASPAVAHTARDVRLLASNLALLRGVVAKAPPKPALAALAPVPPTLPAPGAGGSDNPVLRRLTAALARAVAERGVLEAQLEEAAAAAAVRQLAAVGAAAAASSPSRAAAAAAALSGNKRQRPMVAAAGKPARPLRRRVSEEAFTGGAAQEAFLAGEHDFAADSDGEEDDDNGVDDGGGSAVAAAVARAEVAAAVAEAVAGSQQETQDHLAALFQIDSTVGALQSERDALAAALTASQAAVPPLAANAEALAKYGDALRATLTRATGMLASSMDATLGLAAMQLEGLIRDRRDLRSRLTAAQAATVKLQSAVVARDAQVASLQRELAAARAATATATATASSATAAAAVANAAAAAATASANAATAAAAARAVVVGTSQSPVSDGSGMDDAGSYGDGDGDGDGDGGEVVTFHPRVASKVQHIPAATPRAAAAAVSVIDAGICGAASARTSVLTSSSPYSVATDTSLFGAPPPRAPLHAPPASLTSLPSFSAAAGAGGEVAGAARPRRLMAPRQPARTDASAEEATPVATAATAVTTAALPPPRKFVDPYYCPPQSAAAAAAAAAAAVAAAAADDVDTPPSPPPATEDEAPSTAPLPASTDAAAAPEPATLAVADCDENAAAPVLEAPKSVAKAVPRRRNLLKTLIQLVPTSAPAGSTM